MLITRKMGDKMKKVFNRINGNMTKILLAILTVLLSFTAYLAKEAYATVRDDIKRNSASLQVMSEKLDDFRLKSTETNTAILLLATENKTNIGNFGAILEQNRADIEKLKERLRP